tara:strand:- start:243 stop:752 length:510 start_codon:yes stop_codon:yes gene_type:complete
VLLRLLLVSHDPDVVFVPSRVLGTKDGGSRRANAILAALTAAAEDDEKDTAVREETRTGGENDNDNDGAPRVDNERRRVIVPLPSHAFERIDVCVAAIREACALPDDAAVHARVSLDAPRHDFLSTRKSYLRTGNSYDTVFSLQQAGQSRGSAVLRAPPRRRSPRRYAR